MKNDIKERISIMNLCRHLYRRTREFWNGSFNRAIAATKIIELDNDRVKIVDSDEKNLQSDQKKVDSPESSPNSVSMDDMSDKLSNNLTGKDENKGDFNTNISASDFSNEKLAVLQNQKQNNPNQGDEVLTKSKNESVDETI